jgi:tellurite resistance protein TerA
MPIDYTKGRGPGPAGSQRPGVSLDKVTLTKSAPAVSLTKRGISGGQLRVNLRWTAAGPSGNRGLLKLLFPPRAIDLDLGCLYEYTDGSKGVVQALGNTFRDRNTLGPDPIIWLDGDDRSGTSAAGENLYIDLGRSSAIRRVLVFAYIYEGAPSWAEANGVVTLVPVTGPQIEIRLDEPDPTCPTVAIAMIERRADEVVVNREIRYIKGKQRALDEAYGWGLNWSPARK